MRNKRGSKGSKVNTGSVSSTENVGLLGIKTDQNRSLENSGSRSPTVKPIVLVKKTPKQKASPSRISKRQIFVLKDLKYSKEADKFADFFMS